MNLTGELPMALDARSPDPEVARITGPAALENVAVGAVRVDGLISTE